MPPESTDSDRDWWTAVDVSWTLLDRDDLTNAHWAVVAPALRADGFDPGTHKPTHDWLRENGFRSLLYILRKYHDRTFDTFWTDDRDGKQTKRPVSPTGRGYATVDDPATWTDFDTALDAARDCPTWTASDSCSPAVTHTSAWTSTTAGTPKPARSMCGRATSSTRSTATPK